MTPQQAAEGVLELRTPEGTCLLIAFGANASGDPDIECSVLYAMLEAGDSEVEVQLAVAEVAAEAGLRAEVVPASSPTTIVIG